MHIRIGGEKLTSVISFKYLGAIVSNEETRPNLLGRTAQSTAAIAKLKPILKDNGLDLSTKIRRMHCLVIVTFFYAYESPMGCK